MRTIQNLRTILRMYTIQKLKQDLKKSADDKSNI